MTHAIVDLAFWSPGQPGARAVDDLLADPNAPLAKHGLTGIAEAYARETGAVMHHVHADWADEMAIKSLGVDGALSEVVPALRGAGLDFFVAKGPTIAYFDYPDPRMRPYTDLDVYVPNDLLDEARDVLGGLGYSRVPQVTGPLGGLGSELHGGSYGVVAEVHGHVIDNLHRRYVAPVREWLPHVVTRTICGVDVPVLSGRAHIALQAIHLGAGHRYQKLVLYRDIAMRLGDVDERLVTVLGASAYLAVASELLQHFSRGSAVSMQVGRLHKPLLTSLRSTDPVAWDEYSATTTNFLALVNQRQALHTLKAALAVPRALSPRVGRRAALRLQVG